MTEERAVLAGGCFWGVQELLRRYDGVLSTRVGYSGGNTPNATYRNISRCPEETLTGGEPDDHSSNDLNGRTGGGDDEPLPVCERLGRDHPGDASQGIEGHHRLAGEAARRHGVPQFVDQHRQDGDAGEHRDLDALEP